MDTIERLELDTLADMPEMNDANLERAEQGEAQYRTLHKPLDSNNREAHGLKELPQLDNAELYDMEIPKSSYAQKQLAKLEIAINSRKVKSNNAVSLEKEKVHNKVSRHLLLSKRNTEITIACSITGIVSTLSIPAIPSKAFTWTCPLAEIQNARGIAQEGYDYLNSLDTQILAGVFIVLASEYELIRTIVAATGVENNAILRTASKEKLIQGILLIESFIHSSNCSFIPKLSLIYDEGMKESGVEPRLTEWMRLVNEQLAEPDLSVYDENALLDKPMKGIKELKKEHSLLVKEQKRKASLKDPLFKDRATFRKDMKEAKGLVKNLEASPKLVSFLGNLFSSEVFLTVDIAMIGQIILKLEVIETATSKKLIEILSADRSALRKAQIIDDLDDPLFTSNEPTEREAGTEELDLNEQSEIEETEQETPESAFISSTEMPSGLSFTEKLLWKKRNSK